MKFPFFGQGKPEVTYNADRIADYLATLSELGITLRNPVNNETVAKMLTERAKSNRSLNPYSELLWSIFSNQDDPESGDFVSNSNDVMWLDFECVDYDEIYAELIEQWATMLGDDFPAQDISSRFDEDEVVVELTLDGEPHQTTFLLDGDWLNGEVFEWINNLLQERGSARRLYLAEEGGQDSLILASNGPAVNRLKDLGVKFHLAR